MSKFDAASEVLIKLAQRINKNNYSSWGKFDNNSQIWTCLICKHTITQTVSLYSYVVGDNFYYKVHNHGMEHLKEHGLLVFL